MLSFRDRVALVTGGSRGIGRAVALRLGRLGAEVVISYARDAAAAGAVVDALEASGTHAAAFRADLASPEAAESLVSATIERFGRVDVAVVNQGIWKKAPLLEMTDEQWAETLGVNLTGLWAVCRAVARTMAPRRSGTIVTVASTAGQRGESEHSHYAAAKGGAIAFTRSLAVELAVHGIRVNAVAPGWVVTDMTRHVLEGPQAAVALRPIPRGCAGTPEEIAAAVAFLASDLAAYVWGEILCVNGGAVMA